MFHNDASVLSHRAAASLNLSAQYLSFESLILHCLNLFGVSISNNNSSWRISARHIMMPFLFVCYMLGSRKMRGEYFGKFGKSIFRLEKDMWECRNARWYMFTRMLFKFHVCQFLVSLYFFLATEKIPIVCFLRNAQSNIYIAHYFQKLYLAASENLRIGCSLLGYLYFHPKLRNSFWLSLHICLRIFKCQSNICNINEVI